MRRYGFIKVASATPIVSIGNCKKNIESIAALTRQAIERGASIVVTPELSIVGYTCADLIQQSLLLSTAEEALGEYLSLNLPIVTILGMPITYKNNLYNCAVVVVGDKICGVVPKSYIPNYSEFYESRWFASGRDLKSKEITLCGQSVAMGADLFFEIDGTKFGIEICEDMWVPVPPSSNMTQSGALLIFNLSATPEIVDKHRYVCSLIEQQSARSLCGYVYCSAGVGESSTDSVFTGNGIIAECGSIIAKSRRFERAAQLVVAEIDVEFLENERRHHTSFVNLDGVYHTIVLPIHITDSPVERKFDPEPFIPKDLNRGCDEIFNIQIAGLAQRLTQASCHKAVIGISGGLDSTLALLVTVATFDTLSIERKNIIAVTMPGFGTTGRTYQNALTLMKKLGVTMREIPIRTACEQHFADIKLENRGGAAYENAQARERTQILMDIANMEGGMVIGTGDLSEMALGWATYNGDQMSMYNVNCSVPKGLVRKMVEWIAEKREINGESEIALALKDVVATPISPELLPSKSNGEIAQCTEDLVGPYKLHDFFIFHFMRNGFAPKKILFLATKAFEGEFEKEEIKKWLKVFLRRFFTQQFKRSAAPDGPKIGSVSLSARGDWRMPSDANPTAWVDSLL